MPRDPRPRRRWGPADGVRRRAAGRRPPVWTGAPAGFDGRFYQLEPAVGFPRPDPPPPIIVGAFGPKMATLAGRVGDGINVQAFHRGWRSWWPSPAARADTGDDADDFLVTAFAGLEPRWLDHQSAERSRLHRLGVDPPDPSGRSSLRCVRDRAADRFMARSHG